jgi:CrcB protein
MAWLALAGAVGTLARYGLGGWVQKLIPTAFPWGTLAVNAAGCFLFGIVWALAEQRMLISGQTRLILLVGFMGAFTTFSTYAFETAQMLDDSEWLLAAANLLSQNVLGIALVLTGIALGRLL